MTSRFTFCIEKSYYSFSVHVFISTALYHNVKVYFLYRTKLLFFLSARFYKYSILYHDVKVYFLNSFRKKTTTSPSRHTCLYKLLPDVMVYFLNRQKKPGFSSFSPRLFSKQGRLGKIMALQGPQLRTLCCSKNRGGGGQLKKCWV
jgi:hypothetical protein